jgi:(p)ppGpp synthase/HD superfamily hydrolase
MPTVDETLEFVKRAHVGQVDKAGRPYWLHLEAVKDDLRGLPHDRCEADEWRRAALLHDVLEDTAVTAAGLRSMGFSEAVVKAVQTVTKPASSGVEYLDFIRSIAASRNPMAIAIKLADLRHNIGRNGASDAQRKKYAKALVILAETP